MKPRFTLTQAFLVGLAALALILAAFVALLIDRSRASIVASSDALASAASLRTSLAVENYLLEAEKSVASVEGLIGARACSPDSATALEPCLASQLRAEEDLAEVCFTHAAPAWQLSLFRPETGSETLCRRYTHAAPAGFVAEMSCEGGERRTEPAPDPTSHLSFITPSKPAFAGRTLWSDLSYAEMDSMLDPPQRRVVVSVLRALRDGDRPLGVVRVAQLAERLDERLAAAKVNEDDPDDPYRVVLADAGGKLVTRLMAADHLESKDGDLRVVPAHLPEEVSVALQQPMLRALDEDHPFGASHFTVAGRRFFAAGRALEHTQSWIVLTLGPEDYYLQDLRRARSWLMAAGALLLILFLLAGGWALRAIRGGLSSIERQTRKMRELQFAPSDEAARFRDVSNVLDGLEHAKTALRALGRYVPIDLVRQLFEANRDPALGSRLRALTLMFTDIKDFTTLSERLPPDRLARLLGAYLAAMTGAVEATGGVVDKYIGDAVMAVWNAPTERDHHPARACRAALACVAATEKLFASPEWEGLPPLVTRFGLHTAEVMVGHFGSPTRLSYTAIGDGVNLAARLEALNKQYGTTILVSGAVRDATVEEFEFRHLDRVAVKGKSESVELYELLGRKGDAPHARAGAARVYEQALHRYFARDFAGASDLLAPLDGDAPAKKLLHRCRALADAPPPESWGGVHVLSEK